MAMVFPELDDGFQDFQSRLPSHQRKIDSDEQERSDLRNRTTKSYRPDEDVCYPSKPGNDKKKSSLPGREADGGVERDLLRFSNELITVSSLFFAEKLHRRFT